MNDFFDNRRILDIVWKRRIHFVVIGAAAILLASIFSSPYFITPKFKSTARVYPKNLSTISDESETEQMLEIINSADVKIKMFDAFNLHEVYKVPRDNPYYMTYMLSIYDKHFAARKTEFETVEIEVLDEDPLRAKLMCDSVIGFYNQKVREIHSVGNWEMVRILGENIDLRTRERDSLLQVLKQDRESYQILDYKLQVPELTRGYMRALAGTGESRTGTGEIRRLYANMISKGEEMFITENRFTKLVKMVDSLKVQYDVYLSEAKKEITYARIVEHSMVPDKKHYPVRWLIVALSLFSSLFAGLMVFMTLDFKK